jgi:hypothetical protein
VTFRALARLLGVYVAVVLAASLAVRWAFSLREVTALEGVRSSWRGGELLARAPLAENRPGTPDGPGVTRVDEVVSFEGRFLTWPPLLMEMSFVSGRDGVAASYQGRTVYVTPDDLLSHQGYDRGLTIPSLSLAIGLDVPLVEALLAERLGVTVPEVREGARLRRVRMDRVVVSEDGAPLVPAPPPHAGATEVSLTPAMVRDAALDAARYLARGVGPDGRFRYTVDASTNRTLPGYDWPRHAGATFFLAQAAGVSHEPELTFAALRAAAYFRERALLTCGQARCVGTESTVEIGSSALGLIALVEIAKNDLDATYGPLIADLARFLRAQQRGDGEFMHLFDRDASRPIDVQLIYFSGEATLALARAHEITHDPLDLDAARRGLAHLVGPAWSFFGDRYYFGEEHWTCQAVADLWERAPDPAALDFCLRWHAYGRRLMHDATDTPFDADGSFGVGPLITPRLTPAASRSEAAIATLDAALRSGTSAVGPDVTDPLAAQIRRSLALLVRQQFRPGPHHLFADPAAVHGAMPGSSVDWQLRIDYAQHAGSAMLRWLALVDRDGAVAKRNGPPR